MFSTEYYYAKGDKIASVQLSFIIVVETFYQLNYLFRISL